ncbi:ovochymase-2-like [Engystomops pustulosus]|uniref:ovochymase-2-like n=1 Tax=Engystomops pustulosus TaxID=76066 RepID=UPI003AFA3FE0
MAETSLVSVLLLLTFMTHVGRGELGRASRCGERPAVNDGVNYSLLSRIVGGTSAKKGESPWIASLKRDGKHFCGGTIISEKHILTAAHCVMDKNVESYLKVFVGDHDFIVKEITEQSFPIKAIYKHPNFHPNKPYNYDIAIVELTGHIRFDKSVQPACLPNPDDVFASGSLCIALGWGRLLENGKLPSSLQQVALPLIEPRRCLHIMGTVDRRLTFETAVCAGYPEGGRDACQGDSGSPLLCQRSHGRWVLIGVTSWGLGCARNWKDNAQLPLEKRGSPGVFTDIQRLLNWLSTNLNQDKSEFPAPQVQCSTKDGILKATNGGISLPNGTRKYYSNNEKCVWTVSVPKGKRILLIFDHFDIEWDYSCDLDYLVIYSALGRLIGKFCGDVKPRPLLIPDSSITLKFISDFQEYKTGFSLFFQGVEPNLYPDSECGSVSVIFEEGEIQTMNHPQEYSSLANCQWVIHGPMYHVIKLTFLVFEIEPSKDCIFDRLVVYHDLQETIMAGKFCGFTLPDPVLSSSNVMQITFTSDHSGNYIGFQATISFIPSSRNIKPGIQLNENYHPRTSDETPEHYGKSFFQLLTTRFAYGTKLSYCPSFCSHLPVTWNITVPIHNLNILDCVLDEVCGTSSVPPRFNHRSIATAEEANPNSWPWHASVNFGNKHVCNGAVVSENLVLTSANCVAGREAFRSVGLIVAGLHDLESSSQAQKQPVRKIIIHPRYNPSSKNNDFALIQLQRPFQYNSYVRPICLPYGHSKMEPSDLGVVTGWHLNVKLSSKLQQLEVPVLLDDVCKKLNGGITDSMFCGGTISGEDSASCLAQSGAPLVYLSDSGNYFIYGIVSWGVGCSENPKPGVYSKVSSAVQWISDMIDSAQNTKYTGNEPRQSLTRLDELLNQAQEKSLRPEHLPSNASGSTQDVYVACKDVMALQSPGEIKLVTISQDDPESVRCQLIIQAPKDQFILLNFKGLNTSCEHHSLVVYEGDTSNKTIKAQLTAEKIPIIVKSTGPVVIVEAGGTTPDAELKLWLSYSFHNQN